MPLVPVRRERVTASRTFVALRFLLLGLACLMLFRSFWSGPIWSGSLLDSNSVSYRQRRSSPIYILFVALPLNSLELARLEIQHRHLHPHVDGFFIASDDCHRIRNATTTLLSRPNDNSNIANAVCIDVPPSKEGHWKLRRNHTNAALINLKDSHLTAPRDGPQGTPALVVAKSNNIVYVNNLRAYLESRRERGESLYYLGHKLQFRNTTHYFHYALTAYVVSLSFLDHLAQLPPDSPCLEETHTEDDFGAHYCLEDVPVSPARDGKGREYMLPFHVTDHHDRMTTWVDDWYYHNKDPSNVGSECCARHPIAFSNYNPPQLLDHMYRNGSAPSIEVLLELQHNFGKS